ncbi:MAG: hypothetical protein IJ466_04345 [Clostridia bacterium]|nr:hypothetical protein [Clostridia bacterium]
MLRQIKLLARLRLINLFGFNEARHCGEKKKKWRLTAMLALYAFLAILLMGYVALMCYGLVKLGAGSVAPLCLAALCGLVVLMFTVLRAGPMLFDLRDYEMLISLPLKPAAVVVSRFLTMYLSNAALCLGVLLPGMAVCGAMLKPGFLYYPMMLLGALLVPLVPMTIAMLLGMLVYLISARMKRRNIAVLVLSAAAMLAVLALPMLLAGMQPDRLVLSIRGLLDKLRWFYPPAGWFGDAVAEGNIPGYLAFAMGSIAFFGAAAWLVGRKYAAICGALANYHTKRSFRMTAQRSRAVLHALFRREWKRYLASPIYVLNTAVGYVLALILSAAVAFSGVGTLLDELPMPLELAPRIVVFILAFCYTLSPTTTSAISLEGRNWWLLKSLPLGNREILGGKLLMNLALALPCWLVSSVLLLAALKPAGWSGLWLALLPLGYILFSCTLGLRVNLKLPSFNWENESVPVKQGKAVLVSMLTGMAASILPALGMALLPEKFRDILSGALLLLLILAAALLWKGCLKCRLEDIN